MMEKNLRSKGSAVILKGNGSRYPGVNSYRAIKKKAMQRVLDDRKLGRDWS